MADKKIQLTDGHNRIREFITSLTWADDILYAVTNYGRVLYWSICDEWCVADINPSDDNPLPPLSPC